MSYITIRVDKKLKKEIEKFRDINWSGVVRQAITERMEYEKARQKDRRIDSKRLRDAIKIQDRLSEKTSGGWSGAEEIRRWRDLR